MKTNIYNPIGDLSEEEITKFEKEYNVKFPKPYRNFMLKYNGGDTDPGHYKYGNKTTDIMTFYNLEWLDNEKYISELIKNNLLPIAFDVYNFPVCIGLSEDNLDKIFIFEIEIPNLEIKKKKFDKDKLFLLANTFEEFLNSFIEKKVNFPFEKYCEKNNIKKIKKLIDEGLSPNSKDNSYNSLLAIAVDNNNLDVVKLLIENGANVNYSGSLSNRTPLIRASKRTYPEIIEYLLEKGADIDIVDDSGNKAIDYLPTTIRMWERNEILSEKDKIYLLDKAKKSYELLKEAENKKKYRKV